MNARSSKILLVEGKSDQAFFSAVCSQLGISTQVMVAAPRDVSGKFNNREGVFERLPTLLKQFDDGRVERLAVIVDADYDATHGLGYSRILSRFTALLGGFGFSLRSPQKYPGGLFFQSAVDFPDVGVWIMPGWSRDGMLEHWVKECISASEQALLAKAINTVASVSTPKFKSSHVVKAEIATWLAWQEAPGRGLENTISAELLDFQGDRYARFSAWLNAVYQ